MFRCTTTRTPRLQQLAVPDHCCDVQVYYNPDSTVLRGRPEAWLRGGWNRWTHARTFPPQPMQPVQPGGTGFLQGTVEASVLLWAHVAALLRRLACMTGLSMCPSEAAAHLAGHIPVLPQC